MADEIEIFRALVKLREAGVPCVLCTVVRTAGSTPRKSAARMIVLPETTPAAMVGEPGRALAGDAATLTPGQIGTIGGGRVEKTVVDAARAMLTAGETGPRTLRYHLTHALGMCCGGEMEIFVEPLTPPPLVVLCGGGHLAQALAPLLRPLGFLPILVEDLEELATAARFPDVERIIDSFDVRDWTGVPLDGRTYVVVVTRDHPQDQALLEQLIDRDLAYLGMIGSRRKVLRFRQRLLNKGFSAARFDRVRAPIGLAIGAQTPAEIAISIAGQLVAVRAERQRASQPVARVVDLSEPGASAGRDDAADPDANDDADDDETSPSRPRAVSGS